MGMSNSKFLRFGILLCLVGGVLIHSNGGVRAEDGFVTNPVAIAEGSYSFASGQNSIAKGEDAVALSGGHATGTRAVSIGQFSSASGDDAIAVGKETNAGKESAAFGIRASATGEKSSAFGVEASAVGDSSIALGEGKALGKYSLAMGIGTVYANKNNCVAIGSTVNAYGMASAAIGQSSFANGDFSIALSGNAYGNYSITTGHDSITLYDDQVAIGTCSVATRKAGEVGLFAKDNHSAEWKATNSSVSIGADLEEIKESDPDNYENLLHGNPGKYHRITRQLTGVAAGSRDTDAVNVAQLKVLNEKIHNAGAVAGALAALKPLDFDPEDKLNFAVGYGKFDGYNAIALGAFYRPNERVLLNLGMAKAKDEKILNFGVAFRFGKGVAVTVSKSELASQVKKQEEMIHTQQGKITELTERVSDLTRQMSTMQQQINELRALVTK